MVYKCYVVFIIVHIHEALCQGPICNKNRHVDMHLSFNGFFCSFLNGFTLSCHLLVHVSKNCCHVAHIAAVACICRIGPFMCVSLEFDT